MSVSPPSSEKLLAPMNFFWMNSSKSVASVSRVRIRTCSFFVSLTAFSVDSIRAWSHWRTSRLSMCMNWAATFPQ